MKAAALVGFAGAVDAEARALEALDLRRCGPGAQKSAVATAEGAALASWPAPIAGRLRGEDVAVAFDGALLNGEELRAELAAEGGVFRGEDAGELLLHLLARSDQKTLVNRLVDALHRFRGAWVVAAVSGARLIAARGPGGERPLGLTRNEGVWGIATEGTFVREIEPGEMVIVEEAGVESIRPFARQPRASCTMELLQLSRRYHVVFGREAYALRLRLGELLARDFPARAAVVVPGEIEGLPGALGYGRRLGLPVEPAFDGGTLVRSVVYGRRVVLVDATLTGSRTLGATVRKLRAGGALEVHLRVASPPILSGCSWGVDLVDGDEILMERLDLPRVRAQLDVDSLALLSIEALREGLGEEAGKMCEGCLTRRAPEVAGQLPLFGAG